MEGRHREHIQGNARLRDSEGQGRMVLTDSQSSTGFSLAFQDVTGASEAAYSTSQRLTGTVAFDINNTYTHPGGIQAQGDYVIVGMQGGPSTRPTAFMILKVTGRLAGIVSTHTFEAGRPESPSKIGAAGLTRLSSGQYLVAVYDDSDGHRNVVRFYRSNSTTINPYTQWQAVGKFETECTSEGNPTDQCMASGQGGINFVTDCNGDIYLITMSGTAVRRRLIHRDHHWFQVFKVTGSPDSLNLEKITQQRARTGRRAVRNSSFRWSGSVYVDQNGKIQLLFSDRQTGAGFIRANSGDFVGIKAVYAE